LESLLVDEHLATDTALRVVVETTEGCWVNIESSLLGHPKIVKLSERWGIDMSVELFHSAVLSSADLELSDDGESLRLSAWRRQPFVPFDERARRQKLLEDTWVRFPQMSESELAAITVPVSAGAAHLQDVFRREGCALVTGVLTSEECARLEELWKEDLLSLIDEEQDLPAGIVEVLGRVQKEGCGAWPAAWSALLGKKGCASQRGLPHGAFAWAARLHPNVRRVFAELFGVVAEELAVGLDVPFWKASDTIFRQDTNPQWLHVDQNHATGLTHMCAQGVLYVWPSTDDNASTTALWPRSHTDTYTRLMRDPLASSRSNSVRLSQLHNLYEREDLAAQAVAGTRRVPCPAGSVLLWDSRTVHQGWEAGSRLAQPVCWEPRMRRDEQTLLRKLFMCVTGTPSSHSSSEGRVHGMARCGRVQPTRCSHDRPGLRVVVPHCVTPEKEHACVTMQDALWGPTVKRQDPARNAKKVTSTQGDAIKLLLRAEVFEAL